MSEKLEQYRRDLHEIALTAWQKRILASPSPMALLEREAENYGCSLDELIAVLRAEAER